MIAISLAAAGHLTRAQLQDQLVAFARDAAQYAERAVQLDDPPAQAEYAALAAFERQQQAIHAARLLRLDQRTKHDIRMEG